MKLQLYSYMWASLFLVSHLSSFLHAKQVSLVSHYPLIVAFNKFRLFVNFNVLKYIT